jgi:hypothetical protein
MLREQRGPSHVTPIVKVVDSKQHARPRGKVAMRDFQMLPKYRSVLPVCLYRGAVENLLRVNISH